MKTFLKILVFLLVLFILLFSFSILYLNKKISSLSLENNYFQNNISNNFNTSNLENILNSDSQTVILQTPKDTSFSMSVIGDIMCHNTQFKDAYSNGTYDFSYVFTDIKDYIQNSDISIGNLETTFAGAENGYGGYPAFNTPEALAYNLKDLGLDVLVTANNHSLDTGYSGLESTINFLDNAQISHTGTFTSEENQNTILYKDVNGIKIAFLSYTYGTNGNVIPKGREYCINLINQDLILHHLQLAKLESPDIICVNLHWGDEYETTQNKFQEELTDFLFQNGVDIILGSHPHVLQPMEKRNITLQDGSNKDVFVIYSLGNFMSGQVKDNTRTSIILNLKITKKGDSNKISIDEVSYIPIYTYTYPNYKNYKILDIEKTIFNYENSISQNISNNAYHLLKKELENAKNILK